MKKIISLFILSIILTGCSLKEKKDTVYLNENFSYQGNILLGYNKKELGQVNSKGLSFFGRTDYTNQQIRRHFPEIIKNTSWKKVIETDRTGTTASNYITDGVNVFYNDHKIDHVDIESFTPLFFIYAVDKNNLYINGEKTEIDKNKFKVIENTIAYSTDGKNIYRGKEEVIGADKNSFIGIQGMSGLNGFAYDKNHTYYMGKIFSEQNINTLSGIIIEEKSE